MSKKLNMKTGWNIKLSLVTIIFTILAGVSLIIIFLRPTNKILLPNFNIKINNRSLCIFWIAIACAFMPIAFCESKKISEEIKDYEYNIKKKKDFFNAVCGGTTAIFFVLLLNTELPITDTDIKIFGVLFGMKIIGIYTVILIVFIGSLLYWLLKWHGIGKILKEKSELEYGEIRNKRGNRRINAMNRKLKKTHK